MKQKNDPSIWEWMKWDKVWDLIVIGGGITGITTAIHYKKIKPSLSVLVIEALPTGNVASTKNAGFACFGSVGELREDLLTLGRERVKELLHYRYEGLQVLKETIEPRLMDYSACGGFELFDRDDSVYFKQNLLVLEEMNDLVWSALGLEKTFSVSRHSINSPYVYPEAIFNQYEGALNPVKMMDALLDKARNLGIVIRKGTSVEKIHKVPHQIELISKQLLNYKRLAICTNGMAKEFLPQLDVQMAPNTVAFIEAPRELNWPSCYHMDKGYTYFRMVEGRYIILGGGRHILDNKLRDDAASDEIIRTFLENKLSQITGITEVNVKGFWKGYLGVGKERFPILESIGEDIYCGVRLGGMGVAIGSYLGRALAGMMKA
jgi:gamma-glutamylputrescine oxidase